MNIESGEFIEFLIPGGLTNLRLALTEFEDAESGEITPKVSAGQGKKIRIRPDKWACGVAEAKRLLPQYTIARKPQGLKGENAEMYGRKLAEFGELCRGEREERKTDNGCLRRGGLCRGRRNCRSRMLQPSRNTADSCCKGGIFVI